MIVFANYNFEKSLVYSAFVAINLQKGYGKDNR